MKSRQITGQNQGRVIDRDNRERGREICSGPYCDPPRSVQVIV